MTFPVGWDTTSSYSKFPYYGAISPFPLDVVVDQNGDIAYVSREYDATALVQAVQTLVGQ